MAPAFFCTEIRPVQKIGSGGQFLYNARPCGVAGVAQIIAFAQKLQSLHKKYKRLLEQGRGSGLLDPGPQTGKERRLLHPSALF
jgi:hypothetical protein